MGDFNKGSKVNIVSEKIRDRMNIKSQPSINPRLKIKSYKNKPNTSVSINSGAVILSIGLIVGLSIPAMNFEAVLGFSKYDNQGGISSSRAYDGLAILFIEFILSIFVEYRYIAGTLIIGWFLGGLIAALLFEEEGKRGPYYSAIISVTMTMTISFLLGIIVLTLNKGVFDFDLVFIPMIGALVLSLFLTVISIPLIVIAMIGYRIGSMITNE
ncbi:MAG: hypothetical protein GPJ54_08415 [Candidatus Heimdallarchaeota archaeon]|nr:hypothetical protein [Candidatus Heimdallarchaeota archaeon]